MPDLAELEGKALLASRPPVDCRIIAYDGAVRSSKSVTANMVFARFVRNGPAGKLAIVGRTEDAAIRNIIDPLIEVFGTTRISLTKSIGGTVLTMFGRKVYVFGANDTQARTKIQGLTLVGLMLDEASNLPEEFFNMARSRLSEVGALMILTCNPEGPKHWLKVKWLDRARWWIDKRGEKHLNPAGLPIFRVTFVLDDNVWLNRHNPDFVRELKASFPKGSVFYLRYIESEWVSAEGAVYDMWLPDRMTITRAQVPRVEAMLIHALDYGTEHKTRAYSLGMARVNIGHDGLPDWEGSRRDGINASRSKWVLLVLGEYAPPKATVGQHADGFQDWQRSQRIEWGLEPEWIAIDPAAKVFKVELFARDVTNVMNAHNSVVSGIQTVQSLLVAGNLFVVGDACPALVGAFPTYMWDAKATDKGTTKPIKENDDELDALRYAVYTSRREWRDRIPLAMTAANDSEDDDE